jgi:hypothetical protein
MYKVMYNRAQKATKKGLANERKSFIHNEIAGAGFEPATSGLWARRATRLLYPAANHQLPYATDLGQFNRVRPIASAPL